MVYKVSFPLLNLGKENYPKVEDGDKDKITKELKKLVGKKLDVQIIAANPKEGKLIFYRKRCKWWFEYFCIYCYTLQKLLHKNTKLVTL
jgi:hypothetical protein